ncbi:MAG: hypothetical protein PHY48_03410 [Candidatus Cloacimonetes bacterium]|nr:hypothetical protein [Candidatus Cloacimonadota bacterium]
MPTLNTACLKITIARYAIRSSIEPKQPSFTVFSTSKTNIWVFY